METRTRRNQAEKRKKTPGIQYVLDIFASLNDIDFSLSYNRDK